MLTNKVLIGDAKLRLQEIQSGSVQMCVTSPPYFGLRNYGDMSDQIGLETTVDEYVNNLVEIFGEVHRVLKDDGTFWLNIGDSYSNYKGNAGVRKQTISSTMEDYPQEKANNRNTDALKSSGLKDKDLIGVPWLVAFALRKYGWYLRDEIIWAKAMSGDVRQGRCRPESAKDRFTRCHEKMFLFSKNQNYKFNYQDVMEPSSDSYMNDNRHVNGSNDNNIKDYEGTGIQNPKSVHGLFGKTGKEMSRRRNVWFVGLKNYPKSHFATFPPALVEPCILAGSDKGDIVIDPFAGSGTVAEVANQHERSTVLIELNREYLDFILERTGKSAILEIM